MIFTWKLYKESKTIHTSFTLASERHFNLYASVRFNFTCSQITRVGSPHCFQPQVTFAISRFISIFAPDYIVCLKRCCTKNVDFFSICLSESGQFRRSENASTRVKSMLIITRIVKQVGRRVYSTASFLVKSSAVVPLPSLEL